MLRPASAVLAVTIVACQPVDSRSRSTDTTGSVSQPRHTPESTAVVPSATPPAPVSPAPVQQPQLLVPGDHYSGRVNTVTGETWLGLFPSDSGWALRATDVTVVAIPDACSDTGTQKSGRRVGVDLPGTPLFLVRYAPTLKPGPARALLTERVLLYPGERREFELGSPAVRWAIAAYGNVPAPAPGRAGEGAIREYSLVVSRSPWTTSQSIFTFRAPEPGAGLRSPPAVLWAGDVSGDGRLDVFVDLTAGDVRGSLALYVSNPGEGAELLGKVAEYEPGHCDPGKSRGRSSDDDTTRSARGDTSRASPRTRREQPDGG